MDSAALRASSHDIYQDLHHQLLNGFFAPGVKIKPEDLRKAYGCSANTIRDVLLRLTSAGLTTFEEQRGFAPPSAPRSTSMTWSGSGCFWNKRGRCNPCGMAASHGNPA